MAGTPHETTIGAGKLTYEDLVTLPDDGKRHEVLDGDLVVTPSPTFRHQIVSRNLFLVLHRHVETHRLGQILYAPLDVILDEHTIVEPDILFISAARESIIRPHAIVGAPDFLVEILSPSTAGRDRDAKAKLYSRFGVDHYWIVDPDNETLEVFSRAGGVYAPPLTHRGRVVVHSAPFSELSLDLGEVWK